MVNLERKKHINILGGICKCIKTIGGNIIALVRYWGLD
jgi:hypothetical protein